MRTTLRAAQAALCAALLVGTAACGGGDDDTRATTDGSAAGTIASDVRVSEVALGKSIGADRRIADDTDDFSANDTVYVSVVTDGSAPSATVTARWTFEDGQVVDSSSQTIAPNGTNVTEFHISQPNGLPAGKYRVQILLDDREVESEEFEVKGRS
ncbi:MAG TPA: hypothetical protein VFZ11_03760 [Gemmatimonadaceae bacterium]